MNSSAQQELPGAGSSGLLRRAALSATIVGAVGSEVFMFMVGRHNQSIVLMSMFTVWVLAPFAALVLVAGRTANWPVVRRTALYGVMLVVALGSLFTYGAVALGPPRPQPAAFFLLVPLGSWVLALAVGLLAVRISRRSGR